MLYQSKSTYRCYSVTMIHIGYLLFCINYFGIYLIKLKVKCNKNVCLLLLDSHWLSKTGHISFPWQTEIKSPWSGKSSNKLYILLKKLTAAFFSKLFPMKEKIIRKIMKETQ